MAVLRREQEIRVAVPIEVDGEHGTHAVRLARDHLLRAEAAGPLLVPGELGVVLGAGNHVEIAVAVEIRCEDRAGPFGELRDQLLRAEIGAWLVEPVGVPEDGVADPRGDQGIGVAVAVEVGRGDGRGAVGRRRDHGRSPEALRDEERPLRLVRQPVAVRIHGAGRCRAGEDEGEAEERGNSGDGRERGHRRDIGSISDPVEPYHGRWRRGEVG